MLPLLRTNINHNRLQRTANEYAKERRIYKDLISKNNNVDIKFCLCYALLPFSLSIFVLFLLYISVMIIFAIIIF